MMTPNPECAGLDTTLVDALHTMHDGKFLHLPVTDRGRDLHHANFCNNCRHLKYWICSSKFDLLSIITRGS